MRGSIRSGFVVGNNPRGQKITDEFMDSARKTREFTTVTQESVSEAVVRVRLSKPGDKPAGRRRARAQANP